MLCVNYKFRPARGRKGLNDCIRSEGGKGEMLLFVIREFIWADPL